MADTAVQVVEKKEFNYVYVADGPHCFRQGVKCLCGATHTGEGNSPQEATDACFDWAEEHSHKCPKAMR